MGVKLDGTLHSEDIQDFSTCIKVLAGPGAGKTHWLIRQVKHILTEAKDLGLTRKVGCITYTKKATESILRQIGYNNDCLEVSTIHAFLYKNVIKPYFQLIARDEGFAIEKLDGHDETIITGYDCLSNILKIINQSWLIKSMKSEYVLKAYIERWRWCINSNGIQITTDINNHPPVQRLKRTFINEYKRYVWGKYGLMHHDDVLYFTYKLIEKQPRILYLLVSRYPYLLIDEYQDSSSIQHWFFSEMANAGCKVTLIGDKAQSIYSFAGADMMNLDTFSAPNLITYAIEDNHRSTQNVVDLLNILRPEFHQESLRIENYDKVSILCGDSIIAYHYAKSICGGDELYALTWKNEDANKMKCGLDADGHSEQLLEHLVDCDSNSIRRRAIVNIVKGIENARQLLMDDAVKCIAKGFQLSTKDINNKKEAIMKLNILLKSYDEYSNGSLLDLLNNVRKLNKELSKVSRGSVLEVYNKPYKDYAKSVSFCDDNTHFITIHKSKGLGFDNVLLVFPQKEIALDFLLHTNLNKQDDAHRIYYVACSRAKNRLFLNMPELNETESAEIFNRFGNILHIECLNQQKL